MATHLRDFDRQLAGIEAKVAGLFAMELSPRSRGLIERMGELACDMWGQTMDCWCQRDKSAASALAHTGRLALGRRPEKRTR